MSQQKEIGLLNPGGGPLPPEKKLLNTDPNVKTDPAPAKGNVVLLSPKKGHGMLIGIVITIIIVGWAIWYFSKKK